MDSSFSSLFVALRQMEQRLVAVIDGRREQSVVRYTGGGETVFGRAPCADEGSTFDPVPVYDVLDDGPIFDEEQFVDPVFTTTPDSDHDDLGDEPAFDNYFVYLGVDPVYNTDLDNIDNGPIFDVEPCANPVADAALDSDHAAVTVLNPAYEEAEPESDEDFINGSTLAATATTTDAPFNCSTKFLSEAVTTTLQLQIWSVFSHVVATEGVEYKWWDPGLPDALSPIEFISYSAHFVPAYLHEIPIVLLKQRMCGGFLWLFLFEIQLLVSPDRDIHGMVVFAQWYFSMELSDYGVSLLEIQLLEVPGSNLDWHMHDCHLLQFVGRMTSIMPIDSSADYHLAILCVHNERVDDSQTHSWSQDTDLGIYCSSDVVLFRGCVLTISQVPCIALYSIQISVPGQATKQSELAYIPCLLFAAAIAKMEQGDCSVYIAAIVDTVGKPNAYHFGVGIDDGLTLHLFLIKLYIIEGTIGVLLVEVTNTTNDVESVVFVAYYAVSTQGIFIVMNWVLKLLEQCCIIVTKAVLQSNNIA